MTDIFNWSIGKDNLLDTAIADWAGKSNINQEHTPGEDKDAGEIEAIGLMYRGWNA